MTLTHAPRLILCLHGTGTPERRLDESESRFWLPADQLDKILDLVGSVHPRLDLTFDDGNRSDFSIVLPALAARGLTAQFFPVADDIGRPGYLSHEELSELSQAGMAIGSHGLRHVAWREVASPQLHDELTEAHEILTQGGSISIQAAACPFGSYDRRVLRVIRELGLYSTVYTTDGGPTTGAGLLVPRYVVRATDPLESLERLAAVPPDRLHRALLAAKRLVKRNR